MVVQQTVERVEQRLGVLQLLLGQRGRVVVVMDRQGGELLLLCAHCADPLTLKLAFDLRIGPALEIATLIANGCPIDPSRANEPRGRFSIAGADLLLDELHRLNAGRLRCADFPQEHERAPE